MRYSPVIQKLINLFSKFPTVGPRTSARFVFFLLRSKQEDVDELMGAVSNLKKKVKTCPFCFNLFEPSSEIKFCKICSNSLRNKSLLCLIEKETDLLAIENTKKYKGLYFVLGGTISSLRKTRKTPSSNSGILREKELIERVKKHPEIKEIIIATNTTNEGIATALYLERLLKPIVNQTVKITRLARGMPTGGELEYADEETLYSALEGRK
jgi:recombination protein RecR